MNKQYNSHILTHSIKLTLIFFIVFLITHCKSAEEESKQINEYKKEISSKLIKIKDEKSLLIALEQYTLKGDIIGKTICYKQLGSCQREKSHFSDAINSHQQGLDLALKLNDTVEIVRALNNLGTDFRRVGAHSEASQHHYQALHYAEEWSGLNTPTGTKNRIIALNGIGNISLMLGYYNEAEEKLREALKYEIELKSPIGQAINYANLGSIFEIRKQYDSAYIYYQKSLEQNKIAKSHMGIGLCLIHLGSLYENEHKYDLSKIEYQKAYDLMEQISDKWHWLEACLSIARIHLITNNIPSFKHYIKLAEKTAIQIESPEHLAAVYYLKHNYYIKQGNYKLALNRYKQHKEMQDSIQGVQKASRYMDIRLGYEQTKNAVQLQKVETESKMEQQRKQYAIYLLLIIIIVSSIITALLYYAFIQRTRSNKILKRFERTRTIFFTNITHEFRTSLTVIQGLNRQLHKKKNLADKEKIAFREAIERQSKNLLNLVNQLLDLAKLNEGVDNPQWKRGDIVAYLEMTAETYRLYAGDKNINLTFYSDVSIREMDFIPSYIDKIVSNVLSNAIKYTQAGGKVDFIISNGQRLDTILIRISDTGEGIPQEDIELIFESFYRSPQTKIQSGTGIGLAFTKMMVEKMRGKIEVESKLGVGTTFTITLPLNSKQQNISLLKEDEKPTINLSLTEDTATQTNKTFSREEESNQIKSLILIIEDNRDISIYLKSLLIEQYRVITAWNGQEGLEIAEKYIPDLIITDVMMPIKDGYQFASEKKQNRLINHIPLIMLTAKVSDEDLMNGLSFGIEAYMTKPFKDKELLLRIENILDNRRLLKEKNMNSVTRCDFKNTLENDTNLKFLQTVTDYIYSQINNPQFNANFLANKMAMSVSQLSRKINAITGYSTISYILQIKLNKAKKMLLDNSIPVSEVAEACGFYDASHFSHLFKREFGVSPSQFHKIPNKK